MANPAFINLTKDIFTLVATAVTTGQVHRINTQPRAYLSTYKLTGEAAPANDATLGVPAFVPSDIEEISSSEQIDVYLMPVGVAGRVRVDV